MIAPTQSAPTAQSLAQSAIPQEDAARKEAQRDAWKAYRGQFAKPLKVKPGDTDDNVITNRCAPIVDKGVSFLFGQVLKIEATDEKTEDDSEDTPSPIQDFINGLWGDDDDKMTLLSKIAINGGNAGQCFVKLIPAQDDMEFPRIVNLDPRNIRIVTDPEDCDLHLAYIIEYPGAGDLQKRQIISRIDPGSTLEIWGNNDPDDHWTITNYMRRSGTGVWMQVDPPEEWPYPFAPIFTCQNLPNPNDPWGLPDLSPDIIEMNRVLNFIQSNIARILKFFADPKLYAKGVQAEQIRIAVGEILCLPNPDSEINAVEMRSDLSSSRSFAADIRSDMDEQSRVPAVAQGRITDLPRGNISGVALELLFQPLIEKTTTKRRLAGSMIRAVTRAALVLSGLIDVSQYETYKIELRWPDLLPIDDIASAQTATLLKALGVSTHTLLGELGYNPEDEADKNAQEDAQTLKNYSQGRGLPPATLPNQQQAMPMAQQSQEQQPGEIVGGQK